MSFIRFIFVSAMKPNLKLKIMKDETFPIDLIDGKRAERWFANILRAAGNTDLEFNEAEKIVELRKWDIACTDKNAARVSFEVKWDKMSTTTGNLAVEYFGRYAPSGIAATTADWFVFLSGDYFYMFATEILKEIIYQGNFRSLMINNESAYVYLLPLEQVKKYATKVKNNH